MVSLMLFQTTITSYAASGEAGSEPVENIEGDENGSGDNDGNATNPGSQDEYGYYDGIDNADGSGNAETDMSPDGQSGTSGDGNAEELMNGDETGGNDEGASRPGGEIPDSLMENEDAESEADNPEPSNQTPAGYDLSGVTQGDAKAVRTALAAGRDICLSEDAVFGSNETIIVGGLGDVYLYLNGHSIKVTQAQQVFEINKGITLHVIGGSLKGANDNPGYLFNCKSGGSLYLENVFFDGFKNEVVYGDKAVISATRCAFTNNYGSQYGSAIHARNGSYVKIEDCLFEGNEAVDDGGAINFNGCTFETMGTNRFVNNASGDLGGAISLYGMLAADVSGCVFESNTSKKDGGAIFFDAGSKPASVTDCTFIGNRSYDNGGAVGVKGYPFTVDGCVFEGNVATNRGGGIRINGAPCTIKGSTFTGNESLMNSWGDGGGGVEFGGSYDLTIESDCVFDHNYAGTSGGAVAFVGNNNSRITINGIYTNNLAENHEGGAILVSSNGPGINGQGVIQNARFEGNRTGYDREGNIKSGYGGGILCNGYIVVGDPDHAPTLSVGKSLELVATKALLNGNGTEARQTAGDYQFTLSTDYDASNVILTGVNDANGNIDFGGKLSFNQTNFPEGEDYYTYTYYLRESDLKEDLAVSKDESVYRIDIPVRKDIENQTIGGTVFTTEKYRIDWSNASVSLVAMEDGKEKTLEGVSASYQSSDESHADVLNLASGSATFTNRVKEYVEIRGQKTWDDDNDRDRMRPGSVTVNLLANGRRVDSREVKPDKDGNWTWDFGIRPAYQDGQKITYTVSEERVDGYEAQVSGYDVTNTHKPATTDIIVTKHWDDEGNRWGMRPGSLTFVVVETDAEGKNIVVGSKTVSAQDQSDNNGNTWTCEFTGLPVYEDGEQISYRVLEASEDAEAIKHYEGGSATDGVPVDGRAEFTNSLKQEYVTIKGHKTWDDQGNKYKSRPESITINVYAVGMFDEGGDELVKSVPVSGNPNSDDGWNWTISDLPKFRNKQAVTYRVEETGEGLASYKGGGGVTLEADSAGENGILTADFTNRHTPETVDITINKIWDDDDNRDGKRGPVSFNLIRTVTKDGKEESDVYETVTLDDDADGTTGTAVIGNTWSYTWEGLSKEYENLDASYRVEEISGPDGYESGEPSSKADGNVWEITNSYSPETIDISGTKYWDDEDDREAVRPETVVFGLYYPDGSEVNDANGDHLTYVAKKTDWSWSFEDLPKNQLNAEGQSEPIKYVVREMNVPDDYELIGVYEGTYRDSALTDKKLGDDSATVSGESKSGIVFVNHHDVETVEISGTKTWNDDHDNDRVRPKGIVIKVFDKDDPEVPIKRADGKALVATVTAGTGDTWNWTFGSLPKYKNADGKKEIEYVTRETAVIITDADGSEREIPINKEGKFVYDTSSVKNVTYVLTESEDEDNAFTNSYEKKTVEVTVTKKWEDGGNRDRVRPVGIKLALYADYGDVQAQFVQYDEVRLGESAGETPNPVISADGNAWTYRFTGLDKYKDGKVITYSVKEAGVFYRNADGEEKYAPVDDASNYTITCDIDETARIVYTSSTDEDGNLVNAYAPKTVTVSGSKTWDDDNNRDGVRPSSIEISLYADGVLQESKNVEADEDGRWEWIWTDLYANDEAGNPIVYSIAETRVHYGNDVTIEVEEGKFDYVKSEETFEYTSVVEDYDVTNSYEPQTTSLTVNKAWEDDGNRDGKRPETVTVVLTANGMPVKYDVEKREVVWNEGSEAQGSAPDAAAETPGIASDADVDASDGITLNEGNDWSYEFTNLPKYSGGEEIAYGVKEYGIPEGYVSKQKPSVNKDGIRTITVTNAYTPEEISVSGNKIWADALENADGTKIENADLLRPGSVKITLYADGSPAEGEEPQIISAKDNWHYQFEGLKKMAEGKVINYTVKEEEVPGYDVTYGEKKTDGNNVTINVTNTHVPERVEVKVTKKWEDGGDRDGFRSRIGIISFQLYRRVDGGQGSLDVEMVPDAVKELTPGAADTQTITFTGLDKYKFDRNGNEKEYVYTVRESDIPAEYDYDTSYGQTNDGGLLVTNTHEPVSVDFTITKKWDDGSNKDGSRPDAISLEVYDADDLDKPDDGETADPVMTTDSDPDKVTVSKDGDNWTYAFEGLKQYKDGGREITYVVREATVKSINGSDREYATKYQYDEKGNTTIITNSYETDETEVSVLKTWDDDNDRDGIRPDAITINLKNGIEIVRTVTLGIGDDAPEGTIRPDVDPVTGHWSYVFTGLDKYSAGREIKYSVEEVQDPDSGYEGKYVGTVPDTGALVITNTHVPEYVSLEIDKHWIGSSRNMPDEVKVQIIGRLDNGEEVTGPIEETIAGPEWKLVIDGTADAGQKLPKYHNGEIIRYYVTEIVSDDAAYVQTDEMGSRLEGKAAEVLAVMDDQTGVLRADVHNMPLTRLVVNKTWANDPAGRHGGVNAVDVTLLKNGADYLSHEIRVGEDGKWTYAFEDLPAYEVRKDESGSIIAEEIVYAVREDTKLTDYNNGKAPQIVNNGDGSVTIINTLDRLDLRIEKKWLADNEAARPESITVKVLSSVDVRQNATSVFERFKKVFGIDSDQWYLYDAVELKANPNDPVKAWKATVENLPRYWSVGGVAMPVSYALEEVGVPEGYTSLTNVDDYGNAVVINTGETSVAGIKIWDDSHNAYGYRPAADAFAERIQLLRNGEVYLTGADKDHFRWLDASSDSWSFEFHDLPTGYDYALSEKAGIVGYKDPVVDGLKITNPFDYTELTVRKVWDDNNNLYASRPDNVSFTLLADGSVVNVDGIQSRVTLGNRDGESYTWKNLPKVGKDGKEIIYGVRETTVPTGYTSSVAGSGTSFTVTNSYRPGATSLTVRKAWDDLDDAAGLRPGSIQVALVRNGENVDTVTLNSSNAWTHEWNDLPLVLSDGKGTGATYGVRELTVISGYSVTVSGSGENYVITNYYRAPQNPGNPDTPGNTPGNPTPSGGDTPGTTPDQDPDNRLPEPEPYNIPDEPTPLAGASQVLGSRRAAGGSVLGARRSPQTGDNSSAGAYAAAMSMAGAMMGAWFALRKRRNHK